ncbi:multicopper oxidase domain-containing protein [Streptomyces sp. M19]
MSGMSHGSGSEHGEHGGHGGHGGHQGHGSSAMEGWTFTKGVRAYEYPLQQRAATLWYHDHRMDFSAPQVWRGLAGFFLVTDDEEDALPLPGGDRDVPLMLCDRAFEEDGSFRYPSLDPTLTGEAGVREAYDSGVLGDVQLVNGAPWPVFEVVGARYRFRLLNASNARRYRLALEAEGQDGAPFVQIGSDGGLLDRPATHHKLTMAPAERFDVVVDFARYRPGTRVTLVNTLEDGAMREVMQFRVGARKRDESHVPAKLSAMPALRRSQSVRERHFDFRLTNEKGGHKWTVNSRPFSVGDTWATRA